MRAQGFSATAVYNAVFQGLNNDLTLIAKVNASWAPRITEQMWKATPFRVRASTRNDLVLFIVNFNLPLERTITKASRGQLIAIPPLSCLAIALRDTRLRFPAVLLGTVEKEYLDALERIKQGDMFKVVLTRVET